MSKIYNTIKDSVASFANLPISGNSEGDVRVVRDTGYQYYWHIPSTSGTLADWKVINDPEPSPITSKEKDFIELLNEMKLAYETFYETYSYTGNQLTLKEVWTNNTQTLKLYSRSFIYTGNQLTSETITRISDNKTLTRTYIYVANKLTERTIS